MSLDDTTSVVFVCVANAARSQMAEGLARQLFKEAGLSIRVQSAGSKPRRVDPYAVLAMREIGIDISGHESKSVDAIDGNVIDTVITLCDQDSSPPVLTHARHVHWPVDDPDSVGELMSDRERLGRYCAARDVIRGYLDDLIAQLLRHAS